MIFLFGDAEKPKIADDAKEMLVGESFDALLGCRASGDPVPTIVWKKLNGHMPHDRLLNVEQHIM
jgi:hypothetical protein